MRAQSTLIWAAPSISGCRSFATLLCLNPFGISSRGTAVASHLSTKQVDQIVGLVDGWPLGTKLTWDALLRLIARRLRLHPTRQTLARQDRILRAFRARKAALRDPLHPCSEKRVLVQENRRLVAKNDRLSSDLASALEYIALLQYNAYTHGLKKSDLEAPMPVVDRGQTA